MGTDDRTADRKNQQVSDSDDQPIGLPEGATVLEERQPADLSVELALELAPLGLSELAIEALGGEDAVLQVRAARKHASGQANGDGERNGGGAETNGH